MHTILLRTLRPVVVAVLIAFTIIACIPAKGLAGIEADGAVIKAATNDVRSANEAVVNRALDHAVVSERLATLGLSSDEIASRLSRLSDEDLSRFAAMADGIDAGEGGGLLFLLAAVLLIGLFALGILSAADKKIIIQ